MKQTDEVIVLHRISYSETSLIVTVYSRSNGIQKFIFQGGKKRNSAVFPLSICEATYYKRLDSELGKLTSLQSIVNLNGVISNPIKSTIAYFMADVLRQTLQTNQSETALFDFLKAQIEQLNNTDSLSIFPIVFLVNYTKHIGIMPDLNENPSYFNLIDGEFHSELRIGELVVEGVVCQQLYLLFSGETCGPEADKNELLDTLLRYYTIHSPRFNVSASIEIIKEVLHN